MRDQAQVYIGKANIYAKKAEQAAEGAEVRKYKLKANYYKALAKMVNAYHRSAIVIYRQMMAIKSRISLLLNRLRGYRGKNLNKKARVNLIKKINQLKKVYRSKEQELRELQDELRKRKHISYKTYQMKLKQILKDAGLLEKGKAFFKGTNIRGA
ncbi:MAG: hypothetical protein GXO10_06655 [Crenarchaeota archaeon]|nr:hypothetical protein [Thermoproteota archaeon]